MLAVSVSSMMVRCILSAAAKASLQQDFSPSEYADALTQSFHCVLSYLLLCLLEAEVQLCCGSYSAEHVI